VPKYVTKVRVVFKELPLTIHQWSKTAAIANECAYQIEPKTFAPYRTLIFRHQGDINAVQTDPSKVRDLLLNYGERAGVNRARLSACLNSKASLPLVEQDYQEATALSIIYTPTFFINGRPKFGMVSPQDFYEVVDEALRAARTSSARTDAEKAP
jgi:protein-disulfide isomerase